MELEDRGKKRTLRFLSAFPLEIRPALRAQPLTREAHIPHCTTNPYPEKHTYAAGPQHPTRVMLHTAARFVVRERVRVRVGVRVEELRTGVSSIEVYSMVRHWLRVA